MRVGVPDQPRQHGEKLSQMHVFTYKAHTDMAFLVNVLSSRGILKITNVV